MTTAAVDLTAPLPNYLEARSGLLGWLTTTDHKRIGLLYLAGMTVFFLFAVSMALMFRIELYSSGMQYITTDTYNRMMTLHGVAMIFLFIIPGIPAVFGNFFLPILIGAEDVAFPRLNLGSWYCYIIGGVLALMSVMMGGPDTGWTFYRRNCLHRTDLRAQLHKLTIPTLGIFGVHDNIVNPNQSKLLIKGVPQAHIEMMRESRHFPMLDEPERFISIVQEFLASA